MKNKDKDVYQYGIEVLISTAINIMLLLVIDVVSLKRLLNQSNLKSWSSKMIKKSLEAYFFTLKVQQNSRKINRNLKKNYTIIVLKYKKVYN